MSTDQASKLPTPLVPPEVDLRGFKFMTLDIQRLLDSDLYAKSSGEEFKAAVTLWCKAFHQVPAGSLPDDDQVLTKLSGAQPRRWRKLREAALHGWFRCSDGRLYHRVVAEKALDAWRFRTAQRDRATKRRIPAPAGPRHGESNSLGIAVAPPWQSPGTATAAPRHLRGIAMAQPIDRDMDRTGTVPPTPTLAPQDSSNPSSPPSSSSEPARARASSGGGDQHENSQVKTAASSDEIGWDGHSFTGLTEAKKLKWQDMFDEMSIPDQISRAAAWLEANPSKAHFNLQTPEQFLIRWLLREARGASRAVSGS